MMKRRRNDEERRMWVLNEEGLYLWYMRSRQAMRKFLQSNREEIDRQIDTVLNIKPRY